ncbi:hypothetical protein T492DRAFT_54801 [Pavlovales sp. CCMP2436]|nr:hypothetical protein T492DRAFT_54801 [Pavlovales sp. CCMP2436]
MAEEEGLDVIFKAAGFEWREPGCSMCLAMNEVLVASLSSCCRVSEPLPCVTPCDSM